MATLEVTVYQPPAPPAEVVKYTIELTPEEARGLTSLLHAGVKYGTLKALSLTMLQEKLAAKVKGIRTDFEDLSKVSD